MHSNIFSTAKISQRVSTMSFTRDQFSAAFTSILPVFGTIYKLVLTSLGFG